MLPGAELNYVEGKSRLDICLPDKKVAIEYDSWHWHKGKVKKDRRRTIRLLKDGWKVLCIKSNTLVPEKDLVISNLSALCAERPYREIVMSGWGGGV
jgi:very-short-patch-repair endonuclease